MPKYSQRPYKDSQITDESTFLNRRNLLKGLGFIGLSHSLVAQSKAGPLDWLSKEDTKQTFVQKPISPFQEAGDNKETLSKEAIATSYNNFYEFGTSKQDPKENAQHFKVDPWQLSIDGLVETPITLDYDDLFKKLPLYERIYRLRCVEAWSMVIPWIGIELRQLLSLAKPLSGAKYVSFTTVFSPEQMRGQRNRLIGGGIDYPYTEGLTIEEASHPLSLLSVGMYGKTLPPQNGAPIRLVVPWKYGFKSIKSLVKITLLDKQPTTTWQTLAPSEYGFYANVNPTVDHPRWSQARERRILGTGVFDQERIDTQMFNGYDEVAPLYKNLDLRRHY